MTEDSSISDSDSSHDIGVPEIIGSYKRYRTRFGVLELPDRFIVHGLHFIGSGIGFGVAATDNRYHGRVVIKYFPNVLQNVQSGESVVSALSLHRLQHENINGVKEILPPRLGPDFDDIAAVFPYTDIPLGPLIADDDVPSPFDSQQLQYFVYQTLRGLKYLHSAGLVHRDISASNLLVEASCELRIDVTNSCRPIGWNDPKEVCNTLRYPPPEYLLGDRAASPAWDIWAAGCTFAELSMRRELFPVENRKSREDHVSAICAKLGRLLVPEDADPAVRAHHDSLDFGTPPPPLSESVPTLQDDALDLLSKMLCVDPAQRWDAGQLLAHRYFAAVGLHDPTDEPIAAMWLPGRDEAARTIQDPVDLRAALWRLICTYHPELDDTAP